MSDMVKARAASILSSTMKVDREGRPVQVLVPSGSDRAMRVGLIWHVDDVEVTCGCRGSRLGICWHEIAAILYALKFAEVSVVGSKGNAKRLSRLGGYVLGVGQEGEGAELWAVVRTKNRVGDWEQVDLPGELKGEWA